MGVTIIEDTRQQKGKHEHKNEWWGREGVSIVRSKLAFGDYALPPKIAIDSKKDIQELAFDIDQCHKRFRAECVNARDAGCQLIVLVENTDGVKTLEDLAKWREPSDSFAKRKCASRRIEGSRLAKACCTMSERYAVRFVFCHPSEAAALILKLLKNGGDGDADTA